MRRRDGVIICLAVRDGVNTGYQNSAEVVLHTRTKQQQTIVCEKEL